MPSPISPIEVFKALGDEHRLKIVEFLATGDPTCCSTGEGICGCDVQDIIGLSQATVSHHMKVLTQAGLVTSEKRGRWVYYQLSPEGFQVAFDVAAHYLGSVPETSNREVVV